MNKIKPGTIFFLLVAFLALLMVTAQSDNEVNPRKFNQQAVSIQSKDKVDPVNLPVRAPFISTRQGYQMLTDVLDGFGGESESDNYKIPVNSGGQPSTIGISQSAGFVVKAGFVNASQVMRGDANSDEAVGAGDIVYLLNYLFRSDNPPCPMESGDANCSGAVDAGDVVFLISYLYRGGPPPGC
jgi:hypothetical protein